VDRSALVSGAHLARLVVERAIRSRLTLGRAERYALSREHLPELQAILRKAVAGPHSEEEIRRVLQMAIEFEHGLGSPSVTVTLFDLLRAIPEAKAWVRAQFGGVAPRLPVHAPLPRNSSSTTNPGTPENQ